MNQRLLAFFTAVSCGTIAWEYSVLLRFGLGVILVIILLLYLFGVRLR